MVDVAWVALSLIRGVGASTLNTMVATCGSASAVFEADDATLLAIPRIGKRTVAAIRQTDRNATQRDLIRWHTAGVDVIPFNHPNFPNKLKTTDAPALIFVRGVLPTAHQAAVAIVGTRSPTKAMRQLAEQLGRLLGAAGYVVVSGLALGVDGAAHQGAVGVMGGSTLAMLGCGVLNIYPTQHRLLAKRILEQNGALMSEVAPDATVSTPGLVARNRFISAFSDTVIVIESKEDGGAMHTARFALQQGKQLVAVDNTATGNSKLIQSGQALPLAPDLSNLTAVIST